MRGSQEGRELKEREGATEGEGGGVQLFAASSAQLPEHVPVTHLHHLNIELLRTFSDFRLS